MGLVLFVQTPMAASNFGAYGGVYFADNSNHYFIYVGLTTNFTNASNNARTTDLDPTDLATFITSYHDNADVAVYDENHGDAGYYGYYNCVTVLAGDGTRCDHAHVVFNQWAGLGWDLTKERSTACHESDTRLGCSTTTSIGAACATTSTSRSTSILMTPHTSTESIRYAIVRPWLGTVAIAAVLLLAACGRTEVSPESSLTPLAERPRQAGDVRSVVYFRDLPTMVGNSAQVVEGHVTAVEVIGLGGEDEHQFEIHRVSLVVDAALWGDVAPGATVLLEENGVALPYSLVGDRGIYFLVQRRDRAEPTYRPVNDQGLYLVAHDSVGFQTSGSDDPLVTAIEAMTVDELRSQVAAAADAIRAGRVSPANAP